MTYLWRFQHRNWTTKSDIILQIKDNSKKRQININRISTGKNQSSNVKSSNIKIKEAKKWCSCNCSHRSREGHIVTLRKDPKSTRKLQGNSRKKRIRKLEDHDRIWNLGRRRDHMKSFLKNQISDTRRSCNSELRKSKIDKHRFHITITRTRMSWPNCKMPFKKNWKTKWVNSKCKLPI